MTFDQLVKAIRSERGLEKEVPGFDPANGNEQAKFLFLLEAPGPRAVETGIVSFDNPDPTARNFKAQLAAAQIERHEIAQWNIVPWYISKPGGKQIRAASSKDVCAGISYLRPLIESMPNLRCIVLVGSAARQAHVFLSAITTARILSCHHPSARSMNANPEAHNENVQVLRFMKLGG